MMTLQEQAQYELPFLPNGTWILYDGDIWEVVHCHYLRTAHAILRIIRVRPVIAP